MSTRHPDPTPTTTTPSGDPHDPHQPPALPLPRGERRAWNTATALVGGVTAVGLLIGGAGVAGALALTQERNGSWDAPGAVQSIHVDAQAASVYVHTSSTADRVQVQWYESGLSLPDHEPAPELHDGKLSLDLGAPAGGWDMGSASNRNVSVTVPEGSPPVSLDLQGTTNSLSVEGTFKDVVASTDNGAVEATNLEAAVVDARSADGRVLLDGVHVSNRLDAHTDNGMVLVDTQGTSPKRASVTGGSGYYGVAMPTADYWYPQGSQKDFTDPRHPVTTDPLGSDTTDGSSTEYNGSYGYTPLPSEISSPSLFATAGPSASGSPRATSPTSAPSTPSGAASAAGHGHDADTVCKTAPSGRPCLYLQGTPMSVQDSGWMNAWHDGWRSPGTAQDGGTRPSPTPTPSGSGTPARED